LELGKSKEKAKELKNKDANKEATGANTENKENQQNKMDVEATGGGQGG
jgi:hypothetical protein